MIKILTYEQAKAIALNLKMPMFWVSFDCPLHGAK